MQINRLDNVDINLDDGHKYALRDIKSGENIIKYGNPIGHATEDIKAGEHVHTHNVKTNLSGNLEYVYEPVKYDLPIETEERTFMGYVRENGDVGIRNEIWIVNTVGCVNKVAERIAAATGAFHFPHPFGCSQLGDDQEITQKILRGMVNHPNAAGVLVLGLGCENNNIEVFKKVLGEVDERRVRFLIAQEDIDNSPLQQFGQVKVGDIKYKDVNEDGVVNQNDVVSIDCGTAFPSLNYSFSLGLEFKGVGINATFQGAGNQIKNLRYVDGVWGALSDNRNMSQEYYDNCYDVAGANALYPRLSAENVANNAQESTLWYRNVSWFKMRDCELYYRFPASLLKNAKITDAKVFVQGQNLLSFDNIAAMDAENLNTGYPVMKAVTFGLSVVF